LIQAISTIEVNIYIEVQPLRSLAHLLHCFSTETETFFSLWFVHFCTAATLFFSQFPAKENREEVL
jgi:hypothetical protein